MAKELDVYRDWLGITETERPLNYYQLMRLDNFEDGTAKIRDHYRKMNAHVRKFASGDFTEQSQELLNELARAMLCLTDTQRKREYDASLGREAAVEGRRRTLEEVLLANKVINQEQLEKARRFADQVGMEIRDAVLQQKLTTPDMVMLAYAESQGLPYVELAEVGVDETLVPQIPPNTARHHSCVPIMIDGGCLLMASPNPLVPDVEEDLRLRLGMPVRTVLCTPVSVNEAIAKHFPRDMPTPAPAPAAPTTKAAPQAAEPKEVKYLTTEEKIKRKTAVAVIAFNVAVILFVICSTLLGGRVDFSGAGWMAIKAVSLGLLAAGAAYGVTSYLDK